MKMALCTAAMTTASIGCYINLVLNVFIIHLHSLGNISTKDVLYIGSN